MKSKIDSMLHPVRWKIVHALAGRSLTTEQLVDAVGDVPASSIYRHVRALVDANIVEVAQIDHSSGSGRRLLTLQQGEGDGEEEPTNDSIVLLFDAFLKHLSESVRPAIRNANLRDPDIGFREIPLYLRREEIPVVFGKIHEMLGEYVEEPADAEACRYSLATVFWPER